MHAELARGTGGAGTPPPLPAAPSRTSDVFQGRELLSTPSSSRLSLRILHCSVGLNSSPFPLIEIQSGLFLSSLSLPQNDHCKKKWTKSQKRNQVYSYYPVKVAASILVFLPWKSYLCIFFLKPIFASCFVTCVPTPPQLCILNIFPRR